MTTAASKVMIMRINSIPGRLAAARLRAQCSLKSRYDNVAII
jgi:hypothetical protein